MNDQKLPLKQAMKKYYASKQLSEAQLLAIHEKLNEKPNKKQTYKHNKSSALLKWVSSVAATIMLFILAFLYTYTPAVVSSAYADIKLDANYNNGMQAPLLQWLSENRIDTVPDAYNVEMSKFCNLNSYTTTHIRVAGKEQGKLHLFFHNGKIPAYWTSRSGSLKKMNWKLVNVNRDLTLIVMYTPDMREQAITQILDKMLAKLLT